MPRTPQAQARQGGRARRPRHTREEKEALLRQADDILLEDANDAIDAIDADVDSDDEAVARLLAGRRLRLPTVERVRVYGNRMVLEPVVPSRRAASRASASQAGGGSGPARGLLAFIRRFKQ